MAAAGTHSAETLVVAGKPYRSRLLVGTGKYCDFDETRRAIEASGAEIVTVAIRRTNIGCDGVLMNTAIAKAKDPVRMARAMKLAVEAGREAFLAGRMAKKPYEASPSSPESGLIQGKPGSEPDFVDGVRLADKRRA